MILATMDHCSVVALHGYDESKKVTTLPLPSINEVASG